MKVRCWRSGLQEVIRKRAATIQVTPVEGVASRRLSEERRGERMREREGGGKRKRRREKREGE